MIDVQAASVLALTAFAGQAVPAEWHFNFNQGIAEYSVGDFREGHASLALYCAESGVRPGSVGIVLRRFGASPPAGTPATFTTATGRVTITLDGDGAADSPSLAAAAQFRTLWRLLASGRRLQVTYGSGRPMVFPLSGAAELLGPNPCPKQLAG